MYLNASYSLYLFLIYAHYLTYSHLSHVLIKDQNLRIKTYGLGRREDTNVSTAKVHEVDVRSVIEVYIIYSCMSPHMSIGYLGRVSGFSGALQRCLHRMTQKLGSNHFCHVGPSKCPRMRWWYMTLSFRSLSSWCNRNHRSRRPICDSVWCLLSLLYMRLLLYDICDTDGATHVSSLSCLSFLCYLKFHLCSLLVSFH